MVITLLTGNSLRQLWAPEAPHLLRIKPAKIDCLAYVCVGFRPCFGYFKNFQCGEFKPTPLQDFRSAVEQPCSLFKWSPTPAAKRRVRGFNGALCLGNACFVGVTDHLIWCA